MSERPVSKVQITYDLGDERLSKLVNPSPDPRAVHQFIIEYALGPTIRFAIRRILALDASAKIHGYLHDEDCKLFLIVNSERSSEDYENIFAKVYEGQAGRNRIEFLAVLGFIHHPTKGTLEDQI